MKLVIDSKIPYIRSFAERIGEALYLPPEAITPDAVRDADALIVRTRTHCGADLLQGSSVRFVATATIGFDHLDVEYLRSAGIGWANQPGCNAGSVAQWVDACFSVLERDGLCAARRDVVGIVGCGHVGRRVLDGLRRRGYAICVCDPYIQPDSLPAGVPLMGFGELLHAVSVLTFHVPLTPETRQMLGRAEVLSLPRPTVVINTSRGEVVSGAALLDGLRMGRIRGVALDVWEGEPHISLPLLRACTVATPHIAGYSADGKAAATRMALTAVAQAFGMTQLDFSDIQPPELPNSYRYRHPFDPSAAVSDGDIPCGTPCGYNILSDDRALRAHPELFERLRGEYPLRREV